MRRASAPPFVRLANCARGCLLRSWVGVSPTGARGQLRPHPATLERAPAELIDRLRENPFTYFRFINRAWTMRVCEVFADAPDVPIVRLHGDAHVEQFALTKDAWGLDDFDDSARGPAVVDLVRSLGSLDLATRQLGWTRGIATGSGTAFSRATGAA